MKELGYKLLENYDYNTQKLSNDLGIKRVRNQFEVILNEPGGFIKENFIQAGKKYNLDVKFIEPRDMFESDVVELIGKPEDVINYVYHWFLGTETEEVANESCEAPFYFISGIEEIN